MSKKIIFSVSILAVAVLIGGAILIASTPAEAAKAPGTSIQGCTRTCTPYIGEDGAWESFCVVDCYNGN